MKRQILTSELKYVAYEIRGCMHQIVQKYHTTLAVLSFCLYPFISLTYIVHLFCHVFLMPVVFCFPFSRWLTSPKGKQYFDSHIFLICFHEELTLEMSAVCYLFTEEI